MNEKRIKIVIAGGGTGGHLFPGLAVAKALSAKDDVEVVFVGTSRGIEASVVDRMGYRLEILRAGAMAGRGLSGKLLAAWEVVCGVAGGLRLVRHMRPACVLGVGGYASVPMTLAAAALGVPTAIMEQNVKPGAANKLLSRFARRVLVAFEHTAGYFPGRNVVRTGTPVRGDLVERFRALRQCREAGRFTVLVFGGSQGARRLNEAVVDALPRLVDLAGSIRMICQTGKADFERVRQAAEASSLEVEVLPFIDDMAGAYSKADLVVCRAGAATIAELSALGLPAVLVPYPYAAGGHQDANADALVAAGAAEKIPDAEMTGEALVRVIRRFNGEPETLAIMGARSRGLGAPDAADRVAQICLELAGVAA